MQFYTQSPNKKVKQIYLSLFMPATASSLFLLYQAFTSFQLSSTFKERDVLQSS